MPIEKSAGAIIFRKENNNFFYLLLHYPSSAKAPCPPKFCKTKLRRAGDYWDFPKGHIEKGEDEIKTVKREVEEETGLKDIKIIEGFREWIKYFFKFEGKTVLKFVTFYLAETKTKDVKISGEHVGYKWLPYEDAIEQLTFKNAKEVLKKAHTS